MQLHDVPAFSLIVPTLNRKEEVTDLLVSLAKQTFQDFEVILVDQNQDDRLAEVVERFSSVLDLHLVKQSIKGASAARNTGLRRSKGLIITFPDDDCTYPPDLLANMERLFQDHPEWDGIGIGSRDSGNHATVARQSHTEGPITPFNIFKRVIEFTLFYRKESLNGEFYDERLGVGSASPWWSDEGPDLVYRLLRKGKQLHYLPQFRIYHKDPVASYDAKAVERSYKYGCGRGRFLKKHQYPFWFVSYVMSLYPAGMLLALLQFNPAKFKYYLAGQKGRLRGYFSKEAD